MKNNFLLCLSISCLFLIFSGCDTTEDKLDPGKTSCQIESFKTGQFLISYEYDAQGRISKQNVFDEINTTNDYQTYNYSVIGKVFITSKSGLYKSEITLNAKGDAQKQKETYFASLNPDIISVVNETDYTYDGAGYLTNEKLTTTTGGNSYIHLYDYKFIDGLLVQSISKPDAGTEITYNYTFTNTPNDLAKFEQLADFEGLKSKYLVKTKEEIYKGSTPVMYNYAYAKNANGNTSTQTITSIGKADVVSTLNWKCK